MSQTVRVMVQYLYRRYRILPLTSMARQPDSYIIMWTMKTVKQQTYNIILESAVRVVSLQRIDSTTIYILASIIFPLGIYRVCGCTAVLVYII